MVAIGRWGSETEGIDMMNSDSLPEDLMGWLWVKTSFGKRKRYFRLVQGVLTKHASESGNAWWSIDVKASRVEFVRSKRMISLQCKGEEIFLFSESDEQAQVWYLTFRRAQTAPKALTENEGFKRIIPLKNEGMYKAVKPSRIYSQQIGRNSPRHGFDTSSELSVGSSVTSFASSDGRPNVSRWRSFGNIFDARKLGNLAE